MKKLERMLWDLSNESYRLSNINHAIKAITHIDYQIKDTLEQLAKESKILIRSKIETICQLIGEGNA